jgi:PAS domain S-box-containing protein
MRFASRDYPEPLHNAAGEMVGAVNMLIDVTDSEQGERQIRDSEARFRAIVQATLDCVGLISPDGTLLEINPAGLAMVDADRVDEVVGRSIYDLVAPEDREAVREFNERVCQGEAGCLEFDMIGLRGTRRQMESRAVPLADSSGHVMHLAVARDLTEKKRIDVERNLLAAIVESSDDAIVSKNLNGIITSWNKGAERIFGYAAEEALNKHISLIVPSDHSEDVAHVLNRIRRGERVDHYQTKRRTKDGGILDISLTVSPVRDADGTIVGASKVARNITSEKRTEEALKRSEDQLREANRRKDEFLAMLAHELRNPLSAIQSAVRLARQSEAAEQLDWSMEVIERQAKQLARLTDDLLDVSRITQGKIQLRKEVVDIGPILYGAVDTVRPLIEDRKHTLNVAFGSGLLRVKGDPARLEQIVVNLLTNAAKYTKSGGRISLIAEQDGSDVVIRVRDNGIGIPAEKLPDMFELFVQGDCSLDRSEGGLGIGLTLVRSLVEMHEGAVTASSAGPGKGSEFRVRIPASASPRTERVKVASASGGDTHACRILVVDDNVDSAKGLARLLKLLGHDVRTAHDGNEAIAVAELYRPNVVLLDIGLPGRDGYEVASQLRQSGSCKDTVIVAVSGYGQEEDRRRGREAGFNFHLLKPIDHDALLTLLSAT